MVELKVFLHVRVSEDKHGDEGRLHKPRSGAKTSGLILHIDRSLLDQLSAAGTEAIDQSNGLLFHETISCRPKDTRRGRDSPHFTPSLMIRAPYQAPLRHRWYARHLACS